MGDPRFYHPTRLPLPTLPGIRDMRQLGQSVRQAILSAKPPRSIDLRASARIAARLSILFLFFFLSFSLSLLCAVQSCPTFVLATVQHASKANRLLASSRIARRFGFFYPSSPSHPSAFHSRSFMVDIDG